jgi:hypothetical protein
VGSTNTTTNTARLPGQPLDLAPVRLVRRVRLQLAACFGASPTKHRPTAATVIRRRSRSSARLCPPPRLRNISSRAQQCPRAPPNSCIRHPGENRSVPLATPRPDRAISCSLTACHVRPPPAAAPKGHSGRPPVHALPRHLQNCPSMSFDPRLSSINTEAAAEGRGLLRVQATLQRTRIPSYDASQPSPQLSTVSLFPRNRHFTTLRFGRCPFG